MKRSFGLAERLISLALALAMCVSLPMSVLADETTPEGSTVNDTSGVEDVIEPNEDALQEEQTDETDDTEEDFPEVSGISFRNFFNVLG